MFRPLLRCSHVLKISNVVARSGIIRLSSDDSRCIGLLSLANAKVTTLQVQPTRYYCKKGKDECPPVPPDPCKEKKPEKKVEPPCDIKPTCQKIEKVKPKKVTDKELKDACKRKEKPLKPPKVVLKECKPVDIHPCQPPCPAEKPSKIPSLDECATPDLLSECPKPQVECPEEKDDGNSKTMILIGLLVAAATLAGLYFAGFFDGKKEKKSVKKVSKKKTKKRVAVRDPKTSAEIPNEIPYLLIGGGTASFSAFRAIKSAEPTAKVLVITNESFHPYMRPPLSKEMWYNDDKESVKKLMFKQWNGSERNLYYEPEDFYIKCKDLMTNENGGVAVARGYTVTHLDAINKIAYLDDGYEIHYDKCLIATGSTPKQLKVFELAVHSSPELDEKIKLFRNIYDFEDLYDSFNDSKSIAIIGGGFLGSELACALSKKANKQKKIYQIFREPGNMGKILPEYLSTWTTKKIQSEGVEIVSGTEVVAVSLSGKKQVALTLRNGKTICVDQAVVAVGVEPNTDIAEKSSLEVDPELGGYLVNTELLARSNLYIAGDCACFYDVKLGRRRIEHHDHAVVTGRLAGENMTGQAKPYLHQSMFWSDLGPDVGYEAIGIVDASLPTVGVFSKASEKDTPAEQAKTDKTSGGRTGAPLDGSQGDGNDTKKKTCVGSGEADAKAKADSKNKDEDKEDYGKGIVFYLRDDVVVGIVLWNVFNRMAVARQVLKDERKYDDLNEVAKLFNIHEE